MVMMTDVATCGRERTAVERDCGERNVRTGKYNVHENEN